VKTVKNF